MPSICCEGSLSWNQVEPGETLTDIFKVFNCGEAESLLNWQIYEWPEWGEWTFNPDSGYSLTPEMGKITINVEVNAPLEGNNEFNGKIKVSNIDDPNNYCEIDVYLKTPRDKAVNCNLLTQRILERFPLLQKLFFHSFI